MPKLTNHAFSVSTADGQRYKFESEIHVSTDGEFSCTVPDYLVTTLDAVGKPFNQRQPIRYTRRLKVNHRAYAPSKADLLVYVNAAHAEYYKAEEITELLICYDWFAEVSYFIRPDGSICENGRAPGAQHDAGGKWAEHNGREGTRITGSGGQVDHYSVGVFAAVYKRVTYRRASGDTVTYVRLYSDSAIPQEMDWARRLVGFCGLSQPKEAKFLKHMPLTEEAAKFFFESMLAMCEIGRRFKNFFGDEANVLAAIEGRGPSLLSGASSTTQPDLLTN